MGELVVRRCEAADVAVIAGREPEGRDYARTTFERQQAGRCLYLVAWLDGEPVGSGELEWSPVPELKNLHVQPAHRGTGIGSAIAHAAEEAARDHGRIALAVGLDNPAARRLYERLGYRGTGRTETYTYSFVDDAGRRRTATETAEYLEKTLPVSQGSPAPASRCEARSGLRDG